MTAEVFADMASALRLVRPAWEEIFKLGKAPLDSLIETSALIEQAQAGSA